MISETNHIGKRLRESGLTSEQLDGAARYAAEADIRILSACHELGYLGEVPALRMLRDEHRVPTITLVELKIAQCRFDLVPIELCRQHIALPIRTFNRTLFMVMQDPSDQRLQRVFEQASGLIIKPVVALQIHIRSALAKHDTGYVIEDAQIVSVSSHGSERCSSVSKGPAEYRARKADAIKNLKLGLEALQRSEFADALLYLQQSVRYDPFDVRPHLYLARLYEGLDNPVEAISSYRRILSIDDKHATAIAEMTRLRNRLIKREDHRST